VSESRGYFWVRTDSYPFVNRAGAPFLTVLRFADA
jgi:hypothetical protein